MDPNRRNLEAILNLPTHRLLRKYKKMRREYYSYFNNELVADCYCDVAKNVSQEANYRPYSLEWYAQNINRDRAILDIIKAELNTREHVAR